MKKYMFHSYYPETNLMPHDLYPVQYGEEQCMGSHFFGPCIRQHYLIHYIYDGKGIFKISEKVYELQKGEFFLIPPRHSVFYQADKTDPWFYRWIEFDGSLAKLLLQTAGFKNDNFVLKDTPDFAVGNVLEYMAHQNNHSFESASSALWNLMALLTKDKNRPENETPSVKYVNQAKNYIQNHFYENLTVIKISEYLNIDRSYFCRIFKQETEKTPQRFLMDTRMNIAAQYLKNLELPINEIAANVGYSDTCVFSRAFKNFFGLSPKKWRKLYGQNIY